MSQKRIFNNIFIKGNGKVGTALKNFFTKNNITFFDYDKSLIQNKDVVFLAIKDESINIFIQEIKNINCQIFHFAGSKPFLKNATLIHPFASISQKTDLSKITFIVLKSTNKQAKKILKQLKFKFIENETQGIIRVYLKYVSEGQPAIFGIKRISKPSCRVYSKAKQIKPVLNGLGISIISTSRGLMTDKQAREANVGGEILCNVW